MKKGKLNFSSKGLKVKLNDNRKVGFNKDKDGVYHETRPKVPNLSRNDIADLYELISQYLSLIESKLKVPWINEVEAARFKIGLEAEYDYYGRKSTEIESRSISPDDSIFENVNHIQDQMAEISSINSPEEASNFGREGTYSLNDLEELEEIRDEYSKLPMDATTYDESLWLRGLSTLNHLIETRNVKDVKAISEMNLRSSIDIKRLIEKYDGAPTLSDAKPLSFKAFKKKVKKVLNDGQDLIAEFEKKFNVKVFRWGASPDKKGVVDLWDEDDVFLGTITPATQDMRSAEELVPSEIIYDDLDTALHMAQELESQFDGSSESGYVELDNGQVVAIYYEVDGNPTHALNMREVESTFFDMGGVKKYVGVFKSYDDYYTGAEPLDKKVIEVL